MEDEEIEKYHSEWIQKLSDYFGDAIVKAISEKEQQKHPEKSISEIQKEIKKLTLGELVLFMSKEKK